MGMFNRAPRSVRTAVALVVTGAIVALFGLAAPTEASSTSHRTASASQAHNPTGLMRLRGTTTDGRHFKGTFHPTSFDVVSGALMATGEVTGWIVGKGRPQRVTAQQVTTQVLGGNGTDLTGASSAMRTSASSFSSTPGATTAGFVPAAASCPILHLDLGPLNLDVLGLQVHLNQVVLDIVAQSGAGNLLGNLLCAVAGLLDGSPLSGLLGQLSTLLNQILGVLGGLQV